MSLNIIEHNIISKQFMLKYVEYLNIRPRTLFMAWLSPNLVAVVLLPVDLRGIHKLAVACLHN